MAAQCPICGSTETPLVVKAGLTTAGWVVFAVLLVGCFPICWLPFVIDSLKGEEWKCPGCGVKRA
jgi:DNA-directed RNA polymerase subunit RPC12/RpoP